MVGIFALWLPILLSAVGVFIVSSIIHMVLKYHSTDFKGLPDEAGARAAMQPLAIPPGEYIVPWCGNQKDMGSPEYQAKLNEGPVAFMTVMPNGPFKMGASLIQWFIYSLVVGVVAAYVGGRALGPGAHYLKVFQFVGVTSFACYTMAGWQHSIWYKRSWLTTVKNTLDGLVYSLVTAGVFGWLWPGI